MGRKSQEWKGYIFILPSLIGVLVFLVIPFLDVIKRSFFSPTQSQWVGLENYIMVLNNDAFKIALKNTSRFLVVCIPILLLLAVVISFWLENYFEKRNIIKAIFLVPMAIPTATIVVFCQILFDLNGFLNQILKYLNIAPKDWLNSGYAFGVLVFIYIWKNIGYSIVLFCASLENLDRKMFESAELDGARQWQQFIFIAIPNLVTPFFIIIVLSTINAFKVFRESYLIAGDYPQQQIYMLQNVFNNWFRELSVEKMSAGAVISAAMLIVFVLILEKFWRKRANEK